MCLLRTFHEDNAFQINNIIFTNYSKYTIYLQ